MKRAFQKSARLLTSAEFATVFEKPEKKANRYFVVLSRDNGTCTSRLGLAISKKCSRLAVDRNRIKRIVRECFRLIRSELPGRDIVVLCRKPAIRANNTELTNALSALLGK